MSSKGLAGAVSEKTAEQVIKELKEAGGTHFDNMIAMENLTEDTMMENLNERFKKNIIYTYTGAILVSVNPYKVFPSLYNSDMIRKYRGQRADALPPHIFAIADQAFTGLLESQVSQSILISGESGAGKTEATKLIMQYLAAVTSKHSWVEQQILEANPVMEAFGNAKTMANDNSSRFGKFVEIRFDSSNHISGARISQYLLEKSRIVTQGPQERNYHVFYQLLAGATPEERKDLHLRKVADYHYLNQSGTVAIPGSDDAEEFRLMRKAAGTLGITPTFQTDIFRVLSAVLHLGNITFKPTQGKDDEEAACVEHKEALVIPSQLLFVDAAALENCLTTRTMFARGETFTIKHSVDQSNDYRDALAKTLYARLFSWLIERINLSISPQDTENELDDNSSSGVGSLAGSMSNLPSRSSISAGTNPSLFSPTGGGGGGKLHHADSLSASGMLPALDAPKSKRKFIGVLDIFGFETFKTNSFEQFCINYANEKFQQEFNRYIFKLEQQVYKEEGLTWTDVDFQDNIATVELLEKAPMGIIHLLNDECKLPRSTDQSFLEKLEKNHGSHKSFSTPRMPRTIFNIDHYAGQVGYEVSGFLEKNRDNFPNNLNVLIQGSKDPFVCELFPKHEDTEFVGSGVIPGGKPKGGSLRGITSMLSNSMAREKEGGGGAAAGAGGGANAAAAAGILGGGAAGGGGGGAGAGAREGEKFASLSSQFREQLNSLMLTLTQTETHYVRCIKPNDDKKANLFENRLILRQLRYSGMLSTVKIRRSGYPVRMPFHAFAKKFTRCLAKPASCKNKNELEVTNMIIAELKFQPGVYQLGRTKVFIRQEFYYHLEELYHKATNAAAVRIQAVFRGCLVRRLYKKKRPAAVKIQAEFRRYLQQTKYAKQKQSAIVIQSEWRRMLAVKRVANLRKTAGKKPAASPALGRRQSTFTPGSNGTPPQTSVSANLVAVAAVTGTKSVVAAVAASEHEAGSPSSPAKISSPTGNRQPAVISPLKTGSPRAALPTTMQGPTNSRKKQKAARMALIPNSVVQMIHFLEQKALDQVGIFRVAGSAADIKILKKSLDDGKDVNFFTVSDHNIVANLLKAYLRELPEPLLTFAMYNDFIACQDIANKDKKIQTIRTLLQKLPESNRAMLHELMLFLCRVARHADVNKMTTANLAIVFGPNLLRPKIESMETLSKHAAPINQLIQFFLDSYVDIFEKDSTGGPAGVSNRVGGGGGSSSRVPGGGNEENDAVVDRDAAALQAFLNQDDLSCFHFVEYINKSFVTHWQGRLTKKKISPLELMMFTKESLQTPLHQKVPAELAKEATENFKQVQKFMEDVPRGRSRDFDLAKEITARGIEHKILRDEIFCQICKQIQKNPFAVSRVLGWDLMALCLGCFVPTEDFINYLRNFLQMYVNAGEDGEHARFCQIRLFRTYRAGCRMYPVGKQEFDAVQKRIHLSVELRFCNGQSKVIQVHSYTQAYQVCEQVFPAHHINKDHGFSLYVSSNNDENFIRPNGYVMDAINRLEVPLGKAEAATSVRMPPYHLLVQKRLFFPSDVTSDVTATAKRGSVTNLIYHQLQRAFVAGRLPATEEAGLTFLAYYLQIQFGDYTADQLQKLDLMNGFLPNALLKKRTPDIWKTKVTPTYQTLKGKKADQVQEMFITAARALPFFGVNVFPVTQSGFAKLPDKLEFTICVHEIGFYNPVMQEYFSKYLLAEMLEFRESKPGAEILLLLKSKTAGGPPSEVRMVTPKSNEIAHLLSDYLNYVKMHATKGTALFDYEVNDPTLLPVKRGDVVKIEMKDYDSGWFYARKDNTSGWLPEDYVELDLASANLHAPTSLTRVCDVCEAAISDAELSTAVECTEKLYHRRCFNCHSCNKPLNLASGKVMDVDGEPHCVPCADEIAQVIGVAAKAAAAKLGVQAAAASTAASPVGTPATATPAKTGAAAAATPATPAHPNAASSAAGADKRPAEAEVPVIGTPELEEGEGPAVLVQVGKPIEPSMLDPYIRVNARPPRSSDVNDRSATYKNVLRFEKEPLRISLLHNVDDEYKGEAIDAFLDLMKFMTDYPDSSNVAPAVLMQRYVRRGIDMPTLRPELYCQVIAQLTENPRPASVLRGWHVLASMTGCFPAPKEFMACLKSYLEAMADLPDQTECKLFAQFCLKRLRRIVVAGPRTYPPTTVEYEMIAEKKDITVRVMLMDGSSKALVADASMTIKEACVALQKSIGLKDRDGWSIIEQSQDNERCLPDNTFVLDVLSRAEAVKRKTTGNYNIAVVDNTASFIFKRRIMMPPIKSCTDLGDTVAIHLLFSQALSDVATSRFPIINADEAVQLASLALAVLLSSYPDPKGALKHKLEQDLTSVLPAKDIVTFGGEALKTKIKTAYDQACGETALNNKKKYMKIIESWNLYGSSLFFVQQQHPDGTLANLILAINYSGCHLFNVDSRSRQAKESIPFSKLTNWGATSNQFALITGSLMDQKRLLFLADPMQCEDMSNLLENYFELRTSSVTDEIN